jgi:hypothetical protein
LPNWTQPLKAVKAGKQVAHDITDEAEASGHQVLETGQSEVSMEDAYEKA